MSIAVEDFSGDVAKAFVIVFHGGEVAEGFGGGEAEGICRGLIAGVIGGEGGGVADVGFLAWRFRTCWCSFVLLAKLAGHRRHSNAASRRQALSVC